jgi:hypothetical protein
MDPRFFHLAPSAIRLSQRFSLPGACSLMLATRSELTMADPSRAQSDEDERDAVSIDSDRAEPACTKSWRPKPAREIAGSGCPYLLQGLTEDRWQKCIQAIYSLTRV